MNNFLLALAWWKLPFASLGGFLGGAMIVTTGGGSFVTYPLLLALGQGTVAANATSTAGLWPAGGASFPGYGKEIRTHKKYIYVFLIPAFIGGVLGSYLLSKTSDNTFGYVAPILIFTGSICLWKKKKIVEWGEHIKISTETRRVGTVFLLTLMIASYSSFFGAGVGILMLAALSLLGVDHFVHNIAIKNVLVVVANGVALVYFIMAGLVNWQLALALSLGSIPGGYFGSKLIHKLPEILVLRFTVLFGVLSSFVLLIVHILS